MCPIDFEVKGQGHGACLIMPPSKKEGYIVLHMSSVGWYVGIP